MIILKTPNANEIYQARNPKNRRWMERDRSNLVGDNAKIIGTITYCQFHTKNKRLVLCASEST